MADDHDAREHVSGLGRCCNSPKTGQWTSIRAHDILDHRTDPTWPTTWFVPRLDATKGVAFKDVLRDEQLGEPTTVPSLTAT